jgi:hypothetical protein
MVVAIKFNPLMHSNSNYNNIKPYTFSNPNLQAMAIESRKNWGNINVYNVLANSGTTNLFNASNSSAYIPNNVNSSGVCMIHASYGCQPRISSVIG